MIKRMRLNYGADAYDRKASRRVHQTKREATAGSLMFGSRVIHDHLVQGGFKGEDSGFDFLLPTS